MKTILLSQDFVAIVDDEDFAVLSKFKWNVLRITRSALRYAQRSVRVDTNKYRTVLMHTDILGSVDGMEIDHKNGNGLDNRRSNLRFVTHQQNMANKKTHKNNTSGYRGVYRHGNKWLAQMFDNRRCIHLGTFVSFDEAKKARQKAEKIKYGEFCR